MDNWNDALNQARQEFPNPLSDKRRLERWRGWGTRREPLTDEQVVKKTIEWVGKQTQSHTLHRKATAPDRVLNKAAQYHAAETNRRMAKHSNKKTDGRGAMVTIAIMLPICLCLASVLANYIP